MATNKQISRRVLTLNSELRLVSNHYYVPPIDHILSGFFLERTPFSIYVWQVYIPLCDRVEFLHLGFADRLDSLPSDPQPGSSADVIARFFVSKISDRINSARSLRTLENFLSHCENDLPMGSPALMRPLACASILLDRRNEAVEYLELTAKIKWNVQNPTFEADTRRLARAVELNLQGAKEIILDWEFETKNRLLAL